MAPLGFLVCLRICQVAAWSEVRRVTQERNTKEFSISGHGRISDASSPMVRTTRSFVSKTPAAASGSGTSPVFFYVAMEEQAASHFMKATITSLRKKGEFTGPIVIVTDRYDCLVSTLGTELLGGSIATKPKPGGAVIFKGVDGPIHVVTATPRRKYVFGYVHDQLFEQHKALARKHVARASLPFKAGIIIAIDADVLIALSVKPFIDHIESMTSTDLVADLAVFRDTGGSRQRYHCGVVVIYPSADECMKQWLEEDIRRVHGEAVPEASLLQMEQRGSSLLELHDAREAREDSLGIGQEAFASTKCAKSGNIATLPESFMNINLTEASLQRSQAAIFLHFTKWRRHRVLAPQSIQGFLRDFVGLDVDVMSNVTDVACEKSTPHKYGHR